MSADNYYLITRHPGGGYTALMGFASSDYPLIPDMKDPQFTTQRAAWEFANEDYSEYGIRIDPDLLSEEF